MSGANVFWSSSDSLNSVLSNNNLSTTLSTSTGFVRANKGITSGKYYFEVKVDTIISGTNYFIIGVSSTGNITWSSATARGYSGWGKRTPTDAVYGSAYTTNDTISVLVDMDNGNLEFWKNGVSQGISHTDIKTLGTVYPSIYAYGTYSAKLTANFGATPFSYARPTGYKSFEEVTKYLIKNGTDILTTKPYLCKIGQAPVLKIMFDNYGSDDLINMTKAFNESAISLNKVGALGVGNEFECSLNNDILSIKNIGL